MTRSNSQGSPRDKPLLRLEDITHSFSQDTLFRPLSFLLEPGEILGVYGKSGVGKSTLLHILFGLLKPSQGHCLWNEEDTSHWNDRDWSTLRHHSVNYLPQSPIFQENTSPREHYSFYRRFSGIHCKQEPLWEKLQAQFELDRLCDNPVHHLSGGQQRRVALLPFLAYPKKVSLFDEPCIHQDPHMTQTIMTTIQDSTRSQEYSAICVTHNSQVLDLCHKVIEIKA